MLSLFNLKPPVKEEVETSKKQNMFNSHTKIFKKQKLTEEEIKEFNPFMFVRHMSGDISLLGDSIKLTTSTFPQEIEKEMILKYMESIPIRNSYIKFPTFKTDKSNYLESVEWMFKVNKDTALRYIEMLDTKKLKEIKTKYDIFTKGR